MEATSTLPRRQRSTVCSKLQNAFFGLSRKTADEGKQRTTTRRAGGFASGSPMLARLVVVVLTVQACVGAGAPSCIMDIRNLQENFADGGHVPGERRANSEPGHGHAELQRCPPLIQNEPCSSRDRHALFSHAETVQHVKTLQEKWETRDLEHGVFLRQRDKLLSRVIGPNSGPADEGRCCAVCLESIHAQEGAGNVVLIDGCLHPFCLDCILSWVSYTTKPTRPNAASRHAWNDHGVQANRRSQSCPPPIGVSVRARASGASATASEPDSAGRGPSGCPLCKQPILQLFVRAPLDGSGDHVREGAWRREVGPLSHAACNTRRILPKALLALCVSPWQFGV